MTMSPEEAIQHEGSCTNIEPMLQVDLIHIYHHLGVRRKVFLCPTTGKVLICEEGVEGTWNEVD